MKKFVIMIVILIFMFSGCDDRRNALLADNDNLYLQGITYSIGDFDKNSQEKIKSIKKFPTQVLVEYGFFTNTYKLYILE